MGTLESAQRKEHFFYENVSFLVNKYFNQFEKEFSSNNLFQSASQYEIIYKRFPIIKEIDSFCKAKGIPFQSNKYFSDFTNLAILKYGYFPFFYSSNISKSIRSILKEEDEIQFIDLQIKYSIKRNFLLGGINKDLIVLNEIFENNINKISRHLSQKKWEDWKVDLKCEGDTLIMLNKLFPKTCKIKEERIKEKNSEYFKNYEKCYSSRLIDNGKDFEIVYLAINQIDDARLHSERTLADTGKVVHTTPETKETILLKHFFSAIPQIDNFQFEDYLIDKIYFNDYELSYYGAENEIREKYGLPKVGEGWISETKLFYLIKEHFKDTVVIHHGKPIWLGKQHLDIYIPKYNIGIEYQGIQHHKPIGYFGGEEAFENNKARDKRKKELCAKNNCYLIYVNEEALDSNILKQIQKQIERAS